MSSERTYPAQFQAELEKLFPQKKKNVEEEASFWATPRTQFVRGNVLVKRFTTGSDDNIIIMKLNKKANPSKFRFPALLLSSLTSQMKKLLSTLTSTDGQKWSCPGLTESTYDEFSSDEFWSGPEVIRVAQIRMKLYLSTYKTLMVRIWLEVDTENQKTYEKNGEKVLWRGPSASISLDSFRELITALETLFLSAPEVV